MPNEILDRMVLTRGGVVIADTPTTESVVERMKSMLADPEQDGPPELALEFSDASFRDGKAKCRLQMMLAFHPWRPTAWIIGVH